MTPSKNAIEKFLKIYCEKVRKTDSAAYVDLMMDDHFCIKYENQQYYVIEHSSMFIDEDEAICEFLKENFSL
jgi:hypothetical protein